MDLGTYKEIKVGDNSKAGRPFLRQFLICSGVWTCYFGYGLCAGAPTVFIPQIRRENNSTAAITDEMASWLTSATNFSGFICVFVLSILTRLIGRKLCLIVACANSLIAFIVFYCSSSVLHILISQIMQGLTSASQIVISLVVLTEYTSPKYRGIFLTIKSASFSWGLWVSNAIGTFFHWKKIGLMGIICALYTLITVFFIWPKSPYWLASKERYEECAASHRWLKGCDEESEKELRTLISTQKAYTKNCDMRKLSKKEVIKTFCTNVSSREFYKPILISLVTAMLAVFCGKLTFTVYAIDIIKKITENESSAYTGMLILDGITVFSMYLGCVLSKFLKRRTLLFVSSFIGILVLYLMSFYLYLIKLSLIDENNYVSGCLLMLFSISMSCGPLMISTSVFGEVIPIRSRNLAVFVIALSGKLAMGVILKIAPYLFKGLGLHGAFLFFAICSSTNIAVLYKYLPETKDKTLQEIADIINGVKNKGKSIISNKTAEEAAQLMRTAVEK